MRLLRRYERARREDILAMTWMTDGLQRLFNNRSRPLSWMRNRGLNLVDRAAPDQALSGPARAGLMPSPRSTRQLTEGSRPIKDALPDSFTLFAAACLAGKQQPVACADENVVAQGVPGQVPQGQVQSVTKLPYLGLYEIVVEGEVLYADEKLRVRDRRQHHLHQEHDQPDRADEAQALGDCLRRPAARLRVQEGEGQRRAQAGRVLRPRLPVLQAGRGRPRQARQRHHLHVPVSDRVAAPARPPTWPSASGARRTRSRPGTTT